MDHTTAAGIFIRGEEYWASGLTAARRVFQKRHIVKRPLDLVCTFDSRASSMQEPEPDSWLDEKCLEPCWDNTPRSKIPGPTLPCVPPGRILQAMSAKSAIGSCCNMYITPCPNSSVFKHSAVWISLSVTETGTLFPAFCMRCESSRRLFRVLVWGSICDLHQSSRV